MATRIDILMVNPNDGIVSPHSGIEPPLWAGLIASHYKEQGQRVQILDAEACDLTLEQTAEAIRDASPRQIIIVVMGNNPSASSTPKMIVTKKLIERLYCIDGKITVTGLHPSALPIETEMELGVPVLKGKIFDGTPNMPWELLPMDKYRAHNWHCLNGSPRSLYASIYTSLGCPFDCSFCNIHALYNGKHKVWYRDPIEVIKEIDILVGKYNIRNIKFWDELFTLNPSHTKKICDLLIHRNYGLNIWAYARVDTVAPEMLVRMKQAGINWLAYGFESGSNEVLGEVCKRADKQQAFDAVKWTHEAGINILGNFIFGLPGDTDETMRETLEFAKSLNIEYPNFYVAKGYPGSKLYKDDNNWASYSQFGQDNSKANKFRDNAYIEFFNDENYQCHIMAKFGGQAVLQIKELLEFGKPVTRGN